MNRSVDRCTRFTALCGVLLGLLALILACVALAGSGWEVETSTDYFRPSAKLHRLRLSSVMSILSVLFTFLGMLASSLMALRRLWKYWNLLAPGAYLLATLTILLAMCEAARLMHHDGWPAHVYASSYSFLLLATQILAALAGKLVFSYGSV